MYCTLHTEQGEVLDDWQAVVGVSGDAGGRFVAAARRLLFICIYLDTRPYRRLSQKVESGSAYLTRRFVLLVPLIACKMVVAIAVWCVSTGCT